MRLGSRRSYALTRMELGWFDVTEHVLQWRSAPSGRGAVCYGAKRVGLRDIHREPLIPLWILLSVTCIWDCRGTPIGVTPWDGMPDSTGSLIELEGCALYEAAVNATGDVVGWNRDSSYLLTKDSEPPSR
jgi:hypothetical protein